MATTAKQTVKIKARCGHCDGCGYEYHCDDYLEYQCIYGWDLPCDHCEGKGIVTEEIEKPDPKWAREWRIINSK